MTERGNVLPVLVAAALVASPILGANERLRRAITVGDVRHIEAVRLDLLM